VNAKPHGVWASWVAHALQPVISAIYEPAGQGAIFSGSLPTPSGTPTSRGGRGFADFARRKQPLTPGLAVPSPLGEGRYQLRPRWEAKCKNFGRSDLFESRWLNQ